MNILVYSLLVTGIAIGGYLFFQEVATWKTLAGFLIVAMCQLPIWIAVLTK